MLLILAGVSIATLTGENGILSRATEAVEETDIAEEKEKVQLSVLGALAQNNGGESTRGNLNKEFSGRSYIIDENGNVNEYIDISKDVKIGDYVDYVPDNVDETYDKFGETYSGYANGNIGQDDSLKWRVLNINIDGTVDLISDKPTSTVVYFNGARGYNNGVYLLNEYCKTMYSNSSKGAVARSLNIEDIKDKMEVIDKEKGKKAYENYVTATGTTYGTTYSYKGNRWYPLQWKNDNGIDGESNQVQVTEYGTEDDAKAQESSILTVTQTFWYLTLSELQANFISADTRDTSKSDSIYYELLCNNGISHYWLASRCVSTGSSSYANFGLFYMDNGDIQGHTTFNSRSNTNPYYNYVRPIVSLKSDIINIDAGYNEANNGWQLK